MGLVSERRAHSSKPISLKVEYNPVAAKTSGYLSVCVSIGYPSIIFAPHPLAYFMAALIRMHSL